MKLVISSSSPSVGVAFLSDAEVSWSGAEITRSNASAALSRLVSEGLAQLQKDLKHVNGIAADVGPGSFIGTRVGVTFAKTLAYALGVQVAPISSFDLIDPLGVVLVPSRRKEFFIRSPGANPTIAPNRPKVPHTGYGDGIDDPRYPDAAQALALLPGLHFVDAAELNPVYLLEPSISKPKVPFQARSGR